MDDYYYPSDEWPEHPVVYLRRRHSRPRSPMGRSGDEWLEPEHYFTRRRSRLRSPSESRSRSGSRSYTRRFDEGSESDDYFRGRHYRPRSYTRRIRARARLRDEDIYSAESTSSSEGAATAEEVQARRREAYMEFQRKLPKMERIKRYLLGVFAVLAATLIYFDGIPGWNRSSSDSDSWSSSYYRRPKNYSSSHRRDPFNNPYDLHYTRNLGHFWENYRMIMAPNRDYGYWFDDANGSMNVIRVMWAAIEPPSTSQEKTVHQRTRKLMEVRAEELRLARVEWEKFLDTRTRLLLGLVDDKAPWRVYVNEEPVSNKTGQGDAAGGRNWTEDIVQKFQSAGTAPPIIEHKKFNLSHLQGGEGGDGGEVLSTHFDNVTYLALENSARMVTREIVEGHALLFRDMPAVLEHLNKAQEAENAFIRQVIDNTTKIDMWTLECATGLPKLRRWVKKLLKLGQRMEVPVKWLEDRFPISGGGTALLKEEKKTLEWMKTSEELLRVWGAVLMDLQEGLLLMLRQEDVTQDKVKARNSPKKIDFDASWDAWKKRNCGGTHCYDPASPFGGLKKILIGAKTAKVASDEANWSKEKYGEQKHRIWRGIYQKACCEDSELALLLRNGSGLLAVGEQDLD